MRKSTLFTLIFSILLSVAVFGQKDYINPAAKYCEMLGYRYEITSVKGGEVGMVHFLTHQQHQVIQTLQVKPLH